MEVVLIQFITVLNLYRGVQGLRKGLSEARKAKDFLSFKSLYGHLDLDVFSSSDKIIIASRLALQVAQYQGITAAHSEKGPEYQVFIIYVGLSGGPHCGTALSTLPSEMSLLCSPVLPSRSALSDLGLIADLF